MIMLASAQRLRRRAEFSAVVRAGRRAGRGCVVVHVFSRDAEPGPARAGFVVGKAIDNAVVRNRVRRQLRHLMRERLAQFGPGVDIVVRANSAAANRTYRQLGVDLDAAVAAASRTGQRTSAGRT